MCLFQGDLFTFSFNLIVSRDGEDVKFPLHKTCSLTLAWAPREVTCEANYMEVVSLIRAGNPFVICLPDGAGCFFLKVSVKSDEACPTETKEDDWNASTQTVMNDCLGECLCFLTDFILSQAYMYATSEWQVVLKRPGQVMIPINISEASRHGYEFHLIEGRLAFRMPYGQPDSFAAQVNVAFKLIFVLLTKLLAGCKCQQVNGVPVEVVRAMLFSRQGWIIITVDLTAACSMRKYRNGFRI